METYQKTLESLLTSVLEEQGFEQIITDFAYQGFDPVKMSGVLTEMARANKSNLSKDMRLAITLAVTRGTNIEKIQKKMSEAGKRKVTNLQRIYSIQASSKGTGSDIVSLSRIVATYPQGAAAVIARNPGCNSRLHQLNMNLPEFLAFPGANALIPRSGPSSSYHKEYEAFAEAFSKLVNSKQEESERKNFIEITKNSPITGDDKMRQIFITQLLENEEE